MFEQLQNGEILALVCLFSLVWFIVGVLTGRRLPKGVKMPQRQKKRPERQQGTAGTEELYVGNLSYGVSEKEVRKAFERFGVVTSVRLIEHKNGKSKGYGFLEMAGRDDADAAVKGLNGKEFKGRSIVVNSARSRKRRS